MNHGPWRAFTFRSLRLDSPVEASFHILICAFHRFSKKAPYFPPCFIFSRWRTLLTAPISGIILQKYRIMSVSHEKNVRQSRENVRQSRDISGGNKVVNIFLLLISFKACKVSVAYAFWCKSSTYWRCGTNKTYFIVTDGHWKLVKCIHCWNCHTGSIHGQNRTNLTWLCSWYNKVTYPIRRFRTSIEKWWEFSPQWGEKLAKLSDFFTPHRHRTSKCQNLVKIIEKIWKVIDSWNFKKLPIK